MPNINIMIAMALMACITFRLKLVGRLGSFFLKKYIYKYMGKKVKGKSRKMLMLNIKYQTFKISILGIQKAVLDILTLPHL